MRFITGRNGLIVIPDPDCVGGGLERACAMPWLPVGRVCCARFYRNISKTSAVSWTSWVVDTEFDELSARYSILQATRTWFITVSWPKILVNGLPLPRLAYLWPVKPSCKRYELGQPWSGQPIVESYLVNHTELGLEILGTDLDSACAKKKHETVWHTRVYILTRTRRDTGGNSKTSTFTLNSC